MQEWARSRTTELHPEAAEQQSYRGNIMSQFNNVTVLQQASIYFDGKVTSRTILFPDGSRKTLGIMLPGEYQFNTADKEIMEILSGDLDVLITEAEGWKTIKGGQQFEVPANSTFSLKVQSITDYCCSYIPS